MTDSQTDHPYEVEVKHRGRGPDRYTWHIYRRDKVLPVREAREGLRSWQEASEAGKAELEKFLSN
jgi:hypothetical protein